MDIEKELSRAHVKVAKVGAVLSTMLARRKLNMKEILIAREQLALCLEDYDLMVERLNAK